VRYASIKRRELVQGLKRCGFSDPMRPRKGANHDFMVKGEHRIKIPNEHGGDIDVNLLADILKQAGISREVWERV